MEVANPIYDAVFKFLMEDKKSATLLIGAITGFDIEDIELRPTEIQIDGDGMRQWTVYRLDLAAKVRTPEGSRLVLIEVQKAKYHTDIQRFRRYLGSQYASEENYEKFKESDDTERQRALPIFTIYILGYRLKSNHDIPVIRVGHLYLDSATGQTLPERDEFIESLTHDGAIIQLPALKERRRNRLENVLAIFDQALINSNNHHLMRIDDESQPEECRVLIRRLLQAVSDKQVRQRMIVEDEILSEFEERDRQHAYREQMLSEKVIEATRREEEASRREEEASRRGEEASRREEEASRREEQERKQKEEAVRREETALAEIEELKRRLKLLDKKP